MKLRLDKKDIEPFLQSLIEAYDLYAPAELAEGVSVFKRIEQPGEVHLPLLHPQKPLKDVFFPQSEVMFKYEKAGQKTRVSPMEGMARERLVLGARPCDIEAISLIEKVYSGKEYLDVYFGQKREGTTIIGLACNHPFSTCFCSSTGGGPFERNGSDAFLIDLGDAYLLELLTEKGRRLGENRYLKQITSDELAQGEETEKKALKKMEGASIPVKGIEKKLDAMMENPLWDRIHEKCLSCSVCTFLCPTCHCFDIVDEAARDRGRRVRNWDSCLSTLYSQETSGHNPRPTCRERTRQRLMHKLNYFPKNFGRLACVGCGRCILYCPANFDIRQAIGEIQKARES